MSEFPDYSAVMRKRLVLALSAVALLSSCGLSTNPARWDCPWTIISCDMPPAPR